MLAIRKNDTIMLSDSESGKVVDIITTNSVKVYKVEKSDNQILYVEERLVRLSKQCRINYMRTFSREILNFLHYTFTR